jgi:hypothetical protein
MCEYLHYKKKLARVIVRPGGTAQVIECLPSKHETVTSSPSIMEISKHKVIVKLGMKSLLYWKDT